MIWFNHSDPEWKPAVMANWQKGMNFILPVDWILFDRKEIKSCFLLGASSRKITGKSSTIFKENWFILKEIHFLKTEFEIRYHFVKEIGKSGNLTGFQMGFEEIIKNIYGLCLTVLYSIFLLCCEGFGSSSKNLDKILLK